MSEQSVNTVTKQLLDIIPESESDLIHAIKKYNNSLWNIAPELLSNREYWRPLVNIMNTHVGEIDTEWKTQLVSVFNSS
jgi:hypothetical protein